MSADVSGVKESDTSKLGARGSDEGGRLGALQGAATVLNNSSGSGLLGLVLAPIGAAVGAAKGSSEARSPEVVDETRANLRLALQDTDFTELLRQRLAASGTGPVQFAVTAGPSSAPALSSAGTPVGHIIALEYRLHLYNEYFVNPLVGVFVRVSAQVQSPDRKQVIHTATWSYCSQRGDFVQMAANNAAAFRAEISRAAAVLGEAIPYDLYISRQPRALRAQELGNLKMYAGCMDFSDLPSRTGEPPAVLASPTPIPLAPAAQTSTPPLPVTPAAAAPVQVTSVAPSVPSPSVLDGNWQVEMGQLSTTYGTTVGGECPARYSAGATFANGNAEWPRGKLTLAGDGELSGWMTVPAVGTSMLPFIVNLSGRMKNNAVEGTVSGRCTGSFVMRKQ